MLYAESIVKSFGGQEILSGLSFTIGDGERVGLVGPNGSGKSTLLRLIAGDDIPDSGQAGHRGGNLGFLRQEVDIQGTNTLQKEMWAAFPNVESIEQELERLAKQIAEGSSDLDQLISRQAELFEHFESLDGYRIDKRIGRVLAGLGFATNDSDRPCSDFSGGWRMRIALAKVLVHRPNNLLLDEPTNHLDQAAQDWLGEELVSYPGTIFLVTHDGLFHDHVVKRVLDLREGLLTSYSGNYTSYQKQKAETLAARDSAAARQERDIARQERFIERFRSKATKATQVRSREKALTKIKRIERTSTEREVALKLTASGRTERAVLNAEHIGHQYNDDVVLIDANLKIERGDRVVLVGPNGGGKSTLLRILAGEITASHGQVEWASRVQLGYYDQHQDEALDPTLTILDEVRGVAAGQADAVLRDVLARFLFSGEDVHKFVSVLSGGERSRVALAKFLIRPTNVLLLDEPTNHLDRTTQRKLITALGSYEGTVICASHDPEILDTLATRVFDVRDGECLEIEEKRRLPAAFRT